MNIHQQQQQFEALARQAGYAAQQARQAHDALEAYKKDEAKRFETLASALSRAQVSMNSGDPNIQRVENIPGARIPFDYLVDIAMPANNVAPLQGTITVAGHGPFVCTHRYAAFISTHQFQVTDPQNPNVQPATFQGRSFGRQRPIHSAWDLNDGSPAFNFAQFSGTPPAWPGNGSPFIGSPSNNSNWRTMEPDFRVEVIEAGSAFPRQNKPVPSSLWTEQINSPFALGALDFWARNTVMTIKISPLHANNPAFGNVSAFTNGAGATGNFPFLGSQYDVAEGIVDEASTETSDPITRSPDGILVIGYHGYHIVQPAGAGPY